MSTKQTPAEAEEVKDLEQVEEVQDLAEAPEEVKEVQDLAEVPEEVKEAAPVLKSGGLRGISTPTMIHTHLDNFLAKIAGQTPVDANIRNSLEYWLNEIAGIIPDNLGKKLYYHPIAIYNKTTYARSISMSVVIICDRSTKFTSFSELISWCRTNGISYLAPASGACYSTSRSKMMIVAWIDINAETYISVRGHDVDDTNTYLRDNYIMDSDFENILISDSGVNRIL